MAAGRGEPPSPARWERTEPDPTPVLPEGWETRCPVPEPSPGAEDGLVAIACRVTTD
ncbi:hypothetical protein GCM10023238_20480 [Streptomyces heliomycini]